jgi:GTP-binding protein LepA
VFDNHYDSFKGVIAHVRVVDGSVSVDERLRFIVAGTDVEALEVGIFRPQMEPAPRLEAGEVGYIATGLKDVRDVRVGDTVTSAARPAAAPLPGYQPVKPMVFAGLYPLANDDYPELRAALDKLRLSDAAIVYEPESSVALGFGFRCGFLGMLHMEIVRERLEREYDLQLLVTAPSVEYRVKTTDGNELLVDNPAKLPAPNFVEVIYEPWVHLDIISPSRYIGTIMELVRARRGTYVKLEYLDETRVLLQYEMPLAELIVDFYDLLKSQTAGFASLDYHPIDDRSGDLVKLDILVNSEPVDALSTIIHEERAQTHGRALAEQLRRLIPRQLFDVPIQAAVGSKIIARETVKALRKDVLAKCYGGDISRKRKLLDKQAEGKKRMKRLGSVEVPQEAFMAVLSRSS